MVKYFIPETKKEVQLGECVTLSKIEEDELTRTETIWKGVLNEENVEELTKMGLLSKVECTEQSDEDYDEEEDVTEMIELMSENLQMLTEISSTIMKKVEILDNKIRKLQASLTALLVDKVKGQPNERK